MHLFIANKTSDKTKMQGNEDKIKYFNRKGGTSWSSCIYKYDINQWEIQTTLIENCSEMK